MSLRCTQISSTWMRKWIPLLYILFLFFSLIMNLPCFFGRWLSLLQGNASVGKGYLWGCMQEQILQEVTDSQVMFHCIFKLELAPSCIAFVGLHKFVGLRMPAYICNLAAFTSLPLVAFVNMHARVHAVELNELSLNSRLLALHLWGCTNLWGCECLRAFATLQPAPAYALLHL